jgi:hypothetical protein
MAGQGRDQALWTQPDDYPHTGDRVLLVTVRWLKKTVAGEINGGESGFH